MLQTVSSPTHCQLFPSRMAKGPKTSRDKAAETLPGSRVVAEVKPNARRNVHYSCSHSAPEGDFGAFFGRHGRTNPAGRLRGRRQQAGLNRTI